MLTKEECEKALYELSLMTAIAEKEECNGCSCESCGLRKDSECKGNSYLWYFKKLIEEHFDNPQIDWLKNCMREEAFNLIFSSQEEVNKWFDRMRWHVKKCDEYGRELDILKNNPPLKFDELKEGMWIWDDIDKEYRKVYGKWIYSGDEYFMKKGCKVVFISEDEYFYLIYEPNRFYRKEVVQE